MGIVIAILVFGIIIAIHEFGHFAVAKLCGIRVNKFAIGMGPCIFKKQKGETEYSLRLLPIGGFCAMEGEDGSSDDERAFHKKPIIKRMAVLVAGAFMNIVLGFVIVVISTSMSAKIPTTEINGFLNNSTSAESGLEVGDKIVSVNGSHMFTDYDLSYKISSTAENEFDLVVLRDGEKVSIDNVKFYRSYHYYVDEETGKVVELKDEDYTEEELAEYKVAETRFDFYVKPLEKNFLTVIDYSARKTVTVGRLIWMSLIDLVTGKYGFEELSGPVGIVGAIGEASAMGIDSLLGLVTFITINVGIFNLLPLPALDGGRVVFLLVEAIRRKPIKPEHEGIVHFVGLALFMILMVIITFTDIMKLF